jgi:hypothetical protein
MALETDFATVNESPDIESITYDYSKNGELLRRQIAREILSNTGVWADVAFLHQDRDPKTDGWKPAKITITRFKRVGGFWKKQNHFNANSARRADQIIAVLAKWRDKVGANVQESQED